MTNRLIFLGGTVGANPWRDKFIIALVHHGFSPDDIFNPVVADWNAEAAAREEEAKANARFLMFYIADPKQEGLSLSAYSMVEATMALYDKPERTVVVFDTEGLSGHALKATQQTMKVLKARFPGANISDSPAKAAEWFGNQAAS